MRKSLVAAGLATCVGAATLVLWTGDGDYDGRLVQFLPSDVDAALRCEGVGLAEHRIAKLFGVVISTSGGFLDTKAAVRAVLGREVLASTRDDEFLVLTRLSRSGRALVDAALAVRGTAVPDTGGRLRSVDVGRGTTWFCGRDRDVLAVGTDEKLVGDAMVCGARGAPAKGAPFRRSFDDAKAIAGRVEAWSRGAFADEWLGLFLEGGPASFVLDALPLDESKTLGATLDLDADGARLRWTTDFGDALPAETRSILAPDAASADDLLALARSFAPPDETMVVAGARIRADEALRRFFAAQPEPLRNEEDESEAADALGRVACDGAAFVLARLRETDGLDVESSASNATEVVAGSILALRLRDPRGGDAALRIVKGALLRVRNDDPRWALVAPAAVVAGDLLVIASFQPLLDRAMAARTTDGPRPAAGVSSQDGGVFVAQVQGPRLYAFEQDLRGAVGRAARPRESASMRRAVLLHLRATHPETGAAFDTAVDTETARLTASRGADAFHRAVAAHLVRIASFAELASAAVDVRVDGGTVVVDLDVRLR